MLQCNLLYCMQQHFTHSHTRITGVLLLESGVGKGLEEACGQSTTAFVFFNFDFFKKASEQTRSTHSDCRKRTVDLETVSCGIFLTE